MAEVFGDRDDFAVEAGIEPDGHTAGTVWGHMCIWVRGIALGDIGVRYCGLHDPYSEMSWLAENIGSLWDDELAGLDDISAWNFLDGMMYGYHGDVGIPDDRTLEQCQLDAERWGRFNFLTNWGEQFDGYKSFLLSPPGEFVRVLSRRLPPHVGRGVSVSRHGFVLAATEFAAWFEKESQRLGVPF